MMSTFRRIWTILRTIRRYGLDVELDPYLRYPMVKVIFRLLFRQSKYDAASPLAVRLRQTLQELGPIFVKFGQSLSTRADLFPSELIEEMSILQDQVPPFDSSKAREIIEKSLDNSIDALFREFDDISVASASVAQVHHAKLINGDEVVVKILRPGIAEQIHLDIKVMLMLATAVEVLWPHCKRYRIKEVILSYQDTLSSGLDLMVEAANANFFRKRFENDEFLRVPRIYWSFTRTDVMVMERVGGIPIRNVEEMKAASIDLNTVVQNLVSSFFVQAFYDGFFHADLHPGNLFVTRTGQLNVVDFGIMGSLTELDRGYLAENITAILRRDYKTVGDAHIRSGWTPPDISIEKFEVSIRTVCEPFVGQPIGEVSFGALMGRLFRIARDFNINIQPQLLMFQQTYVNLEGLARSLDPSVDISSTVRPVLESWVRRRSGVSNLSSKIQAEAPHWISVAPEIPRLVHSILSNMQKNQMENSAGHRNSSLNGFKLLYRNLFLGMLGAVFLVGAVVDWNLGGFGFLTFFLGALSAVCLVLARPKD